MFLRGLVRCASTPPPPCNSHAHVQATVGVGTVLIWYSCVAITRGGGHFEGCVAGVVGCIGYASEVLRMLYILICTSD